MPLCPGCLAFVYQSLSVKKKKVERCGNQKVRISQESFPMTSEIGVEMESLFGTKTSCGTTALQFSILNSF